jgi:hypothetical protein
LGFGLFLQLLLLEPEQCHDVQQQLLFSICCVALSNGSGSRRE